MEQPIDDGDVENSGFKVSQGVGDLPSAAGHRAMMRKETGGDRSRCVSMTILCLFLLAGGIMVLVLAVSGGDDDGNRTAPLPPSPPPVASPVPAPLDVFIQTNAPVATETPTLVPTTLQPSTSRPTTFLESNFTLEPTETPTVANTTAPSQSPSAVNTSSPTLDLNATQDVNATAFPTTDLFNTTLAPTLAPSLSDNNMTDNNVTDDTSIIDNNVTDDTSLIDNNVTDDTSSENTTSLAPTLSPPGVKTIEPGLNITEDDGEEANNISPTTSAEPTASPTLSSNDTDKSLVAPLIDLIIVDKPSPAPDEG